MNDQSDSPPQIPDIHEPMDEIHEDSLQQEHPHSPASLPPDHDLRQFPHSPLPDQVPLNEGDNSSDDEDGSRNEEDSDDNIQLPSVRADDPWPQPALPKLTHAKIESIKAACLEKDLDDETLMRLKYPPEEPEMLNNSTLFSMTLFNNLTS
ncbi:hypothetical protein AX15_004466, partial [Amanita polypyramis BW_CC]